MHSKNPRLDLLSQFLGQKYVQKIWLCHAQHHMGPWHNTESQKKQANSKKTFRQKDGQTFIGPFWSWLGRSNKGISHLRSIVVDNRNRLSLPYLINLEFLKFCNSNNSTRYLNEIESYKTNMNLFMNINNNTALFVSVT